MKRIANVLKLEFPYLDTVQNKLLLVGFLAVFCLVFLNVYVPFNIEVWGGTITGYIIVGTVVILISQFVLRPLFRLNKFKTYSFLLWVALEVLLIAWGMYLAFGPELDTFLEKWNEYWLTVRYTTLILVGPYLAFVWYLSFRYKLAKIKAIQNHSLEFNSELGDKLLTIIGENEKVILAIKYQKLLCVKSAGNYLELYYLKGEDQVKELVRGSLKELEKKIEESNIVKVHRSYLVNVDHISSLKKTKKSYQLNVQHMPNTSIPVSAGFKNSFEEALKQKVSH
ncbi:LytTR family DNA-binding domain-containing protein [Flagellimonas myxillae]|uniref:LytTR family DNA-binding domain-containing protein n=1 Tax=Flagellimonas myxillae TaxID=2942214 RepID=UPI00201F045F|nr:LytTR family DNA-binding domain-containing protein [Muricauda myxillae]MCL6267052.1 LytTR family transcriptional regulator [Muricauda myxillae]